MLELEIWDLDSDMAESAEAESEAWKSPGLSGKDKALWAIAHALGVLVEEQAEIHKLERQQERLLQSLIAQVKSSVDSLELFTWGDHFLWTWEMGELEGSEVVETELRPCRRKWKGKELEECLEADGQDVEMNLQ